MTFNSGGRPIKPDPRDKKFTKIRFGSVSLPIFPKTLGRIRHTPKDQNGSQACTAHAVSTASEYEENITMSAAWQWAEICKKIGTAIPDGADPRTAMQTAIDLGTLEDTQSTKHLPQDNYQEVGNWEWADPLIPLAEQYKKSAYIKVPFVNDYFDSVRTALLNGKEKGQIVMAFSQWCWSKAPFIPDFPESMLGYHAYVFVDFDTIDGKEYLVLQNSYGTSWGDQGYQYMPREAANREFAKPGCGLFVFEDLTPEQIALAKQETPFGRIQRLIIQIWHQLQMLSQQYA